MRLDTALSTWGLANSRTHAASLIRAGAVSVSAPTGFMVITKPSFVLPPNATEADVKVCEDHALLQFVSRGGIKLQRALEHLQFSAKGLSALDVGISTGGFSDCLLQNGASQVTGVDVGHGQLHPSLHGKVTLLEGVNARELALQLRGQQFDLIVVDVSFISLGLVLPQLPPLLRERGSILALVKPQFELGAAFLNKKGIVKDQKEFAKVQANVENWCRELQLSCMEYFSCALEGSDGNQEFFVFATMDPMSGGFRRL